MALTIGEYVLDIAGSDNVTKDTQAFAAGWFAEAFFSKAVGDMLAQEAAGVLISETVQQGTKDEFDKLYPDRLSRQVLLKKPAQPGGILNVTMNTTVTILYDPLTHMASGVITSDCAPTGIAFQYRVALSTWYPVDKAEGVWPGGVLYWDVATDEPIR